MTERTAPSGRARLPRFLPPDPRVEEPYLLTPQTALRLTILGAIALLVFGVLFLRLWSVQILSGGHYRSEALDNQLRTVMVEAPRGPILDDQGRVLVDNRASKAVVLWPSDLPKGAGWDTELRQLSRVLNIRVSRIKALIAAHTDVLTPVRLKIAVHPDQLAYIDEHQTQFPGVRITQTYPRHYRSQALAAQLLGYVGAISPEQCKALCKDGYRADDRIGQAGVEAAYDRYLRGQSGSSELLVDSRGRVRATVSQAQLPKPGDAVRLTIDIELQRAAEKAIAYGISLARNSHCYGCWAADGGAIVALDPNTGAVLAMASSPTYKPSLLSGRVDVDKAKELLNNEAAKEANFPGTNRVISKFYPPGSTFKPVTALAALETGIVSPYDLISCTPTYTTPTTIPGLKPQVFVNWDKYVNKAMTMPEAIARSCDTYFYQLGMRFYDLPASEGHPLQQWASRFGFGSSTGIDVGPEVTGLLPTPEWRQATYTKETDPGHWKIDSIWKPGDSIQLTIGQKDIRATPLQLARFYAMIANGGRMVTPHIVADVEMPGSKGSASAVLRTFSPPSQASGVDPSALQVVKDGLFMATHESFGTSSAVFGNFKIPIAGKTGTAEEVVTPAGTDRPLLLSQSEFCGYGPAGATDHPTIVVCAVIENGGHGGTAAAPAALRVFEKYFNTKAAFGGSVYSD
jgi:penicillin-binding protein 2